MARRLRIRKAKKKVRSQLKKLGKDGLTKQEKKQVRSEAKVAGKLKGKKVTKLIKKYKSKAKDSRKSIKKTLRTLGKDGLTRKEKTQVREQAKGDKIFGRKKVNQIIRKFIQKSKASSGSLPVDETPRPPLLAAKNPVTPTPGEGGGPETPVIPVPETPVITKPETPVITEPETPVITEPETSPTIQEQISETFNTYNNEINPDDPRNRRYVLGIRSRKGNRNRQGSRGIFGRRGNRLAGLTNTSLNL